MSTTFSHILMIALLVIAFVVGPFVLIWSLNTLFPIMAIPYNFWSWLAVLVLRVTVQSKFSWK